MYNAPDSFEEAVTLTIKAINDSPEATSLLAQGKDDEVRFNSHHSYGRWIRNNWGLWHGSKLKDELVKMGLSHADDMSSTIIDAAICDIKKVPRNTEAKIKFYQDYWNALTMKSALE